MQTNDYTFRFQSTKTPADLFPLLLDIRSWWSGIYDEQFTGNSQVPGDEFSFRAGNGAHYTKQYLHTLEPGKIIQWEVTDCKLNFVEPSNEWTGTRFGFELLPASEGTQVVFTHQGLRPDVACYTSCSAGWNAYLQRLKNKLQ